MFVIELRETLIGGFVSQDEAHWWVAARYGTNEPYVIRPLYEPLPVAAASLT